MADYAAASRTKDHFQTDLLRDHPEIVSLAPRLILDPAGRPTHEAIIVIGVRALGPQQGGAAVATPGLPAALPLINEHGMPVHGQTVPVRVEHEGGISPQG
jgi:hypothetical protein